MLKRMRSAGRIAAAVAATLLAGGIGAAIAASGTSTTLNACADKHDGALRLVSAKASCRTKERHVTWSRTGDPGPQGIAGPQGAAGPAGPMGLKGDKGDAAVSEITIVKPVNGAPGSVPGGGATPAWAFIGQPAHFVEVQTVTFSGAAEVPVDGVGAAIDYALCYRAGTGAITPFGANTSTATPAPGQQLVLATMGTAGGFAAATYDVGPCVAVHGASAVVTGAVNGWVQSLVVG